MLGRVDLQSPVKMFVQRVGSTGTISAVGSCLYDNNSVLVKSWIDILKIGVRVARDEFFYLEVGESPWLARDAILISVAILELGHKLIYSFNHLRAN